MERNRAYFTIADSVLLKALRLPPDTDIRSISWTPLTGNGWMFFVEHPELPSVRPDCLPPEAFPTYTDGHFHDWGVKQAG
jgi:hypothetical protein